MKQTFRWWQNLFVEYTLLFVLTAGAIFLPYYLTGTSLVWQSDGIAQHFPALVQWQGDLKNLLFNHEWPNAWQWQVGLGADYLQTFAYYTMGDIFTYGVALVSKAHVLAYYNLSIVIRLFLAGLSFIVTARHFVPKQQNWQYLIGTFGYIFFGYTAFAAFEHPFFLNPLIIFPLLILTLHRALRKHRYGWFTVLVAWTLWNNFYFAFMMAIGAIVFWLGYQWLNQNWLNWRQHLALLANAIIGALLPMILFFPSIMAVLQSARSGKSLANGLTVYPAYYYLGLPGNLIGNLTTPDFWLTGGFSALSVMAIIFSIRRWRAYKPYAGIWLISLIGVLLPVFAGLLNGGSSPSNRWIFMLALPISLMTIVMLGQLKQLTARDYLAFSLVGLLSTASLFIMSSFNLNMRFGLVIAWFFGTVAVLWFTQHHLSRPKLAWLLVGLTLFNVVLITSRNHTDNTNPNQSDMLSTQSVKKLLANQKNYEPTSNKFERSFVDNQLSNATGIAPATNLPILSHVNNVESYWSLQNGAVGNLMTALEVAPSNPNDVTGNLDNRDVLSNVLGINQRFQNPDTLTPASYEEQSDIMVNGQNVLTSQNAYPLVYLPKYTIAQRDFNQLSATKKEATLADSVVVPSVTSGETSAFAKKVTTAKVRTDQTKLAKNSVHFRYTTHASLLPDGIFLPADKALKGTELHLTLSHITYHPASLTEQHNQALSQYEYDYEQASRNPQNEPDLRHNTAAYSWNWYQHNIKNAGNEIGGYTITAGYADREMSTTQTGQTNLSFFNPRQSVTLNLGQATKTSQEQFIPLTFSRPGTYEFDVSIEAIPTDKRFTKVAKATQATAPRVHLTDDAVTTRVSVKTPRVLATTIPYSSGWSAKGYDLQKINNGFIGIPLHSGQNNIQLTYETPGLTIGRWLSLIGIVLFVLTTFIQRYRK